MDEKEALEYAEKKVKLIEIESRLKKLEISTESIKNYITSDVIRKYDKEENNIEWNADTQENEQLMQIILNIFRNLQPANQQQVLKVLNQIKTR